MEQTQKQTAAPSPRDQLRAYRPDLSALLSEQGAPGYRYHQVYEHLMHYPGRPFGDATALTREARLLLDKAGASTLDVSRRQDAHDGTTKLLVQAVDEHKVETVIMRYRRRTTACVSTQAGCPLGCTFCATGAAGFKRNLTAAEIVDQVREAVALVGVEGRKLSNVVFMGMGEPLLNLDAVLVCLRLLKDPAGLGFAQRSLSVSTVGIPSGIRRLAKDEPQVNLALSLHAPDDALRARLMPVARRHPLREVLKAVDDHFALTHRKLLVEYLLLQGVNDSASQAHALFSLLRGRVLTVNLIPWNPGCAGFSPSPPEVVASFRDILASHGLETTVRASKGAGIGAACGQLTGGRQPKPAPRRRRAGRD